MPAALAHGSTLQCHHKEPVRIAHKKQATTDNNKQPVKTHNTFQLPEVACDPTQKRGPTEVLREGLVCHSELVVELLVDLLLPGVSQLLTSSIMCSTHGFGNI